MLLAMAATFAYAQTGEDAQLEARALSEYTMGVFLLESNAPKDALPHLLTAWELSFHDITIGEKLAEAYYRLGNLTESEAVLEEVIARDPDNGTALLLQARIHYLEDRRGEALASLMALREVRRRDIEVQRMIAKTLFELGRDEEALVAYGEAIDIDPGYPSLQYMYGLLLRKFERREEAVTAFRAAIDLEPDYSDAVMELAETLVELERAEEALAALESLLTVAPTHAEALLMAANLYLDGGQLQEGIDLLEGAAQRSPLSREGAVLLGRAYFDTESYEKSLQVFVALYERGPRTPEMARVLGEVAARASQPETAERYYREAITLEPEDYRNYLALFFASSERFAEGDAPTIDLTDGDRLALIDRAAKATETDDFDAHFLVGLSYQSVDANERAETHLRRALELQPDDERSRLNLAAVLEEMKRYDAAEVEIAALYEQKPQDPTICNFYGYLLSLMGKELDRAEQMVRRALEQDPENGYYLDSLGWVYFARGDFENALTALERAVAVVPDDPVILEHLGDVYEALSRYLEAEDAYRRSLELQGENSSVEQKRDAVRRRLGD